MNMARGAGLRQRNRRNILMTDTWRVKRGVIIIIIIRAELKRCIIIERRWNRNYYYYL